MTDILDQLNDVDPLRVHPLIQDAIAEIKRLRNPSPIVECPPEPKSIDHDPTGW